MENNQRRPYGGGTRKSVVVGCIELFLAGGLLGAWIVANGYATSLHWSHPIVLFLVLGLLAFGGLRVSRVCIL